jgi:hypothetical protein
MQHGAWSIRQVACSKLTNEVRNRSEAELGAAKSRKAGGHREIHRIVYNIN